MTISQDRPAEDTAKGSKEQQCAHSLGNRNDVRFGKTKLGSLSNRIPTGQLVADPGITFREEYRGFRACNSS